MVSGSIHLGNISLSNTFLLGALQIFAEYYSSIMPGDAREEEAKISEEPQRPRELPVKNQLRVQRELCTYTTHEY
jgi:hypothetical protein